MNAKITIDIPKVAKHRQRALDTSRKQTNIQKKEKKGYIEHNLFRQIFGCACRKNREKKNLPHIIDNLELWSQHLKADIDLKKVSLWLLPCKSVLRNAEPQKNRVKNISIVLKISSFKLPKMMVMPQLSWSLAELCQHFRRDEELSYHSCPHWIQRILPSLWK